MKPLVVLISLFLLVSCRAHSQMLDVDAAVKALNAIEADPAKSSRYCAIHTKIEALKDGEDDEPLDAEMRAFLRGLGPEYERAWDILEDVKEETPEGRALNDAFDDIEEVCEGGAGEAAPDKADAAQTPEPAQEPVQPENK